MWIGDYLARRCEYDPGAPALVDATVDPPRRLTYRDLDERANRCAAWLRSRGVAPGDRVAYLGYDGLPVFEAFFACGKLGAAFVPLNWRLHAREIEGMLARATPRLLVWEDAEPMAGAAAHLAGAARMPDLVPLAEALAGWEASPADPVRTETLTELDTATLLFTGGTTGTPKAAMNPHRQVVWNTFNALLADVLPTDTYLNIFPLFHSGGLYAFSVPLLIMGGTVVQPRAFDASRVLRLIPSEGVTVFAGVPTVFQMLTEAPEWQDADLSSLRYCLSGGAPMPVPLIERYREEKGVVFRQGFGMTEFGPDVFSLSSADAVRKAGSIGKPNFFVDARIVDPDTLEERGPDEVGELLLRGPGSMTGYFGDPEATAAAYEEGGWFHTGDLARRDAEGYVFIVDRLKDMFVSGGENVFPAEVEAALYELPGVRLCAVVGVPDERWGEVGVAFVVGSDDLTEKGVLEHLRGRLARYKVPTAVRFLPELPVSGAGKILKTELEEMAR